MASACIRHVYQPSSHPAIFIPCLAPSPPAHMTSLEDGFLPLRNQRPTFPLQIQVALFDSRSSVPVMWSFPWILRRGPGCMAKRVQPGCLAIPIRRGHNATRHPWSVNQPTVLDEVLLWVPSWLKNSLARPTLNSAPSGITCEICEVVAGNKHWHIPFQTPSNHVVCLFIYLRCLLNLNFLVDQLHHSSKYRSLTLE